MRIGVLLAKKGYDEGGCPIGGVIIDNETRRSLVNGHNASGPRKPSLQSWRNVGCARCRAGGFQQDDDLFDTQPV